ncbi:MAG: amylo-alpha-1,6-glucosidase, partial [Spirochaetia bacterium]|nr:amylo-alpha-1,6-glucosidase [Spirochaetia bacterium]
MISFGRHICNDFNIAIEKEWILTNSKGSYASSTILDTNTRKYHGVLVAKYPGIDNRVVVFPNCDEDVEIAGHIHNISTHKYKEAVYPKGFAYLENFSLRDDVVTMLYLIDNIRIKKDIFLMKDSNTTVITYTVLTPDSFAKLHVKPLIAFREAENLIREMPIFDANLDVISEQKIKIQPYMNIPPAFIYNPDMGLFEEKGSWYREFYYLREGQSGFEAIEDLYNVGVFTFDLEYNVPRTIVYSTEDIAPMTGEAYRKEFKKQVKKIKDMCREASACVSDDDYRLDIQQLIAAASSFVIEDNDRVPMIVAGYPWPHYVWLRDTYASMPGLLLV